MKKLKFNFDKEKFFHLLFILGSSIYFIIFVQAVLMFVPSILKENLQVSSDILYCIANAALYLVGLLVPFIIYQLVFKTNIDIKFKVNKGKRLVLFRNILISILLGFLLQGVGMGISGLTALLFKGNAATDFISNFETIKSPFLFSFCIAIFPAVIEELVFRGIIFKKSHEKFSAMYSAILSGLLFGIYHLDIQQFLYAAVLGYAFGLIYNKTRNLLDTIIIHFIIDFSQLYLATSLLEMIKNSNEALADELTNAEPLVSSTIIFCIVLLLIFIPLSIKFYKKYQCINDDDNLEKLNND